MAAGIDVGQNQAMGDRALHDPELAAWAAAHGVRSTAVVALTDLLTRRTGATGRPVGTPLPSEPTREVRLATRFELGGVIGRGGMSEVVRARDTLLERDVALKIARAPSAEESERFLAEARVAAALQHPGILPVYDSGTLSDGRRWLAMRRVKGSRLSDLLDGARAADDRLTALRRLMTAFTRVCEAVGFAHAEGVVHRDIKPSNVMIGEFGEVIVLDWGIACRVGASGEASGTEGFMSPEQRAGGPLDARSDVYALGCVLDRILSAARAPADELYALRARCMADDPADRPDDGSTVARAASDWLDGARRRVEARQRVGAARALMTRAASARRRAAELEARADTILGGIPSHAPAEQKAPGWALEDEAAELRQRAHTLEVDVEQQLQAALMRAPDLVEAQGMLADHYRDRIVDAEAARDTRAIAAYEARLRATDETRHRDFLDGDGRLSLATDPPGARVWCAPYVKLHRRLVPGEPRLLGRTPLNGVVLPRGAHELRIQAAGRAPVIHPIHLGRGEHWDGRPPDAVVDGPHVVPLPSDAWLRDGWCYVPAGWFYCGGDREAVDGIDRRRVWVDGFVIERDPLTYGVLVSALNEMVEAGDAELAKRIAPPPTDPDGGGSDGDLSVELDGRGRYILRRMAAEGPIEDWPVTRISWHAAVAWAHWCATRSGLPWRLPHDLEREKAARGADGRWMPWGDHFDPTWANVLGGGPGKPARTPVGLPTADVSPYGVRGLAGNVRDWCINGYRRRGLEPGVSRLVVHEEPLDDGALRMIRGGGYLAKVESSRAAGRFASPADKRLFMVGVRLVCPYPVGSAQSAAS